MLDLPEQLGPLRTMQAAPTDQGSQIHLSSPALALSPNTARVVSVVALVVSINDTLIALGGLLLSREVVA
jgi:hypothetical protein